MKTAEQVLNQYSATNPCTPRAKAVALFIIREAKFYGVGRTPRSLAAASIFFALRNDGIKFTRRELLERIPSPISVTGKLSDPALRWACNEIRTKVPDFESRVKTFSDSLGHY